MEQLQKKKLLEEQRRENGCQDSNQDMCFTSHSRDGSEDEEYDEGGGYEEDDNNIHKSSNNRSNETAIIANQTSEE